jgi:hypothetical protein
MTISSRTGIQPERGQQISCQDLGTRSGDKGPENFGKPRQMMISHRRIAFLQEEKLDLCKKL